MNQTTHQQSLGRRLTDRIMDHDSPAHGDERERAVVAEASSFALTVGIFTNIAVALVAAILGAIALPATLIVLAAVPAFATSWYAKQRAVDLDELASRVNPLSRLGTMVTVFAGILLVVAAIGWTVFTGEGLVTLPMPDVIGPDAASGAAAGAARGAVIGGMAGVFIGFVALLVGMRRKKRKAEQASPDDLD